MLNIPSHIEDHSYRYKMPALQIKVEGSGNGIKTNLPNLSDVAKSLSVPTDYPLRFFAAEFGTSIEYKQKEERSIIKGKFRREDLQECLDNFIGKFILCPKCHLPELRLIVKKKDLCGVCDACGVRPTLDRTHKLTSYIINHPPPKNLKGRAATNKREEVKSMKKSGKVKRVQRMQLDDPIILECIERLKPVRDESPEIVKRELVTVSISLEPDVKLFVILKAVFGLDLNKKLYTPEGTEILKSQARDFTEEFISALACVYADETEMASWVPTILKLIYDADIVDEDFFLAWKHGEFIFNNNLCTYNQEKVEKLKELAQPFLCWLESAEEASGSEEEDEEVTIKHIQEEIKEIEQVIVEQEIVEQEIVEQVIVEQVKTQQEEEVQGGIPPSGIDLLSKLQEDDDDVDILDI